MIIEVNDMRRCSDKANKSRYIYTIRGTSRDIAIKEGKKSKKAASVSEALALIS